MSRRRARKILLKDTVHLDSPADLYAARALRRRNLFQSLFNRYFRQIRYGCQNSHCETPTCLSCQKRLAQGPFRRLTVLSARTLASFLASQDHPERQLCPHPPLPLQHSGEFGSPRVNVKQPQRLVPVQTHKRDGPPDCLQCPAPGVQQHRGELATSTCDQTSRPSELELQIDGKQKQKDQKSFTQNLYDTLSWRFLQFMRYHDGEFHWVAPWGLAATREHGVSSQGSKINGAHANSQNHMEDQVELEPPSLDTNSQGPPSVEEEENKEPENSFYKSLAHRDKGKIVKPLEVSEKTATDRAEKPCFTPSIVSAESQPPVPRLSSSESAMDYQDRHQCPPSATGASSNSSVFSQFATLSHFTSSNVDALSTVRRAQEPADREQERPDHLFGRTEPISRTCFLPSRDPFNISSFLVQSMVHIFSSTEAVLRSFKGVNNDRTPVQGVPTHLQQSNDHITMLTAFNKLKYNGAYPQLVFSSLWISLESAFAIDSRRRYPTSKDRHISRTADFSHRVKDSSQNMQKPEVKAMSDSDAAHMVKVALAAIVASVPSCSRETWLKIMELRASGHVAYANTGDVVGLGAVDSVLEIMDAFEDELAISLMKRLIRVFTTRRCLTAISEAHNDIGSSHIENHALGFMETLMQFLQVPTMFRSSSCSGCKTMVDDSRSWSFSAVTVEWLRNILLKEWDGKAEVSKTSVVGGTLDFMSCLYSHKALLELLPEVFYTPFLSERLDPMEMPVQWLTSQTPREAVHLLYYPFLFPQTTLVTYFRSINHAAMSKAFESSMSTARLMIQMSNVAGPNDPRVLDKVKTAIASHLVLEIRRDNILTDSLNQLWRRERREMMKPLKVRMGMDEGEEGVDHGGVQQEFFRLAISEAMNPDYGIFTTDATTKMSWFVPCSLEPHYKFELLGLLVSLAVYNGLTLPITFPLALYRKLLDLPVTSLEHIRDGWPDLAKGFKEMLEWPEENVESVFTVSYTFSADVPGARISVDMDHIGREDVWPLDVVAKGKEPVKSLPSRTDQVQGATTTDLRSSMYSPQPSNNSSDGWIAIDRSEISPLRSALNMEDQKSDEKMHSEPSSLARSDESEATLVNNSNRANYVEDYIFWLTDKSIRPQYEAFARGFYTCLDKKALSIFNPETLQTVIEGSQEINLDELEQTTKYEGGWSSEHRVIRDFWSVVRAYPRKKVQRLLEFVTASERIPVSGVRSIMFVIQRSGTDDERLPTSYTCFGRLLLPEYSSRKILKERLGLAIANCQGFGVQ